MSQQELHAKAKEQNYIVTLYYNMACCYQRLGLLDEAVEYLEKASDQLQETIDLFDQQEQALILQRRLQQTVQHSEYQTGNLEKQKPTSTKKQSNIKLTYDSHDGHFKNPFQQKPEAQKSLSGKKKSLKKDKASINDIGSQKSMKQV